MTDELSERFVDEDQNPLPTPDSWIELSINQLIDIRAKLQQKLFIAGRNPLISKFLTDSIQRVEIIIDSKLMMP